MHAYNIYTLSPESDFNEAYFSLNSTEAKSIVLRELEKRILFQHYFEELQINTGKINFDPEILLQNFCAKFNLLSAEKFDNFLVNIKKTREDFVEKLIYEEKLKYLKHSVINIHNINDLFIEKKVKQEAVLFALMRIEQESSAKEIFYRLSHDLQDFGELAKLYSLGAEAKQGGIIGPVQLQTLNPEIRSRLIIMQEGQISFPFTIDHSQFLIIKLIRIDRLTLNNQVENLLRDELFDQWVNRQLNLINLQV
jgi:parvulin-like peptidyl-prolyl isomerase